ncbi:MAG: hypothetical protein LC708_03910 [Actinobacteria bacterium]|nr:hypothetical protein [Actinomycetota bacterium]
MKNSIGLKRLASFAALLLAISVISIATSPVAAAQTAVSQCNGTDNVGGQAVECHYTITNNIDGDATSSTVTRRECHGAANDPPTLVCNSSTTSSNELVTSIDQCNGSGNGGGGTVTCTVDVTNNIVGTVTPMGATVNQCNEAGEGGGTAPTVVCDPFPANTTNATVTQCNEAGNGGGGTRRVQCTVDSDSTTTTILTVTVTQCIGSGNGGGATVTCRTGIRSNITAPEPQPSESPTPDETPPDDGGGGGGGAGGGSGSGGSGSPTTGGETGGGSGINTNQVSRVPLGGAAAGGGSTGGVEHLPLLVIGYLLLAASGPALLVRRRVRAKK